MDHAALFDPVIARVCEALPAGGRVVCSMDTTLFGKTGRKVCGARYRRDPLGPKFRANLVWSQRFLQASIALPESGAPACRARGIPVALRHCPGMKSRAPKGACGEDIRAQSQARKQTSAPMSACEQIADLRRRIDTTVGGPERRLVCAVDSGLTNKQTLRHLPPRTTLLGRVRKDSVLHAAPAAPDAPHRGRPRAYGERLPTPDEIRQGDEHPWQTVEVFAGGRTREMRVKSVGPVRWAPAGAQDLRLVIIAPVAYRTSPNARRNYRDPAYLICTDPSMALQEIVQCYIWRWEIEVNFRDEKTVLGMGEAQVRRADTSEAVPALMLAAYASLLLAAEKTRREERREGAPLPKWREGSPPTRETTQQMINALRAEILAMELEQMNKQGIAAKGGASGKGPKTDPGFIMAPMYSQK